MDRNGGLYICSEGKDLRLASCGNQIVGKFGPKQTGALSGSSSPLVAKYKGEIHKNEKWIILGSQIILVICRKVFTKCNCQY